MNGREEFGFEETVDRRETLHDIITDYFEETTPYTWFYTEEPYQSQYTGRYGVDISGDTRKATKEDILKLFNDLTRIRKEPSIYSSDLNKFIGSIYTGRWNPSHQSGRGKNWISFKEGLDKKFSDWKNDNYEFYDVETYEYNEELEREIDYDFQCELDSFTVEEVLTFILGGLDD